MKSQQQPIVLQDTRGNFYLAFRIKVPKHKSRQYKKHLKYVKAWRYRNKQKVKEYGLLYYKQHLEQFKQYYIKNRKHILKQQKERRKRISLHKKQ